MTDATRKRPQCDTQRQSPTTTSLAHRTRAPSSAQHARREISPSIEPRDGSAPAVSVSAKAAMNHGANHAANTDDDDDDDDYTSSSGSDSDSDEDEEEASDNDEHENAGRLDRDRDGDVKSHDGMPHISGRAKPRIHRVERDSGLAARLSAFLPQMKTANEDLQREIDAGRGMDLRLDEVDEQSEGQYIEMNLGLGVLEEQHSDDEDMGEKSEKPQKDPESRSKSETDSNVMDTLMGNDESPSSKKPTIQEL
ncbi:NOPCHAP1/New4 family protein [Aspergillus melleus]|uniref:NOPCHAP1/New4 family protein n=1 Tax=Aspergillus melleus TaxID=138277 RepID=UPI001E8E74B4|nr:uncharacterized protein LDX57_003847 [Aspergillus melleus]KAH8426106.1 hypothetical protein LDX57_003847 [Aspergillus melleus]